MCDGGACVPSCTGAESCSSEVNNPTPCPWYCRPRQQPPDNQTPGTGELLGPLTPSTFIHSPTCQVRNIVLTDGRGYPPSLGRGAESGAADFVPVAEDGVSKQVKPELRGALSCP